MRYLAFILCFVYFSIAGFSQPLQFIDKHDSLSFKEVDVVTNNKGGWMCAMLRVDSSLTMTEFNHCGEVVGCYTLQIPNSVKVSNVQLSYLRQDAYLVMATVGTGTNSRILSFIYTNTGTIPASKVFGTTTVNSNFQPLVSIYDQDHILIAFNYGNNPDSINGRIFMMNRNLVSRWSKDLSLNTPMRWVKMSGLNDFYIGAGSNVMKFDTSGKNLWSKNIANHQLMFNSVLSNDTALYFSTDFIDTRPDTSAIKRPRYKQVIALHEDGKFLWFTDRIRAYRNDTFLAEYNSRLFFDGRSNIVLNTIDTIKGDSIPSIFAHSWNGLGNATGSKYWSATSKVTDYKSALLNDGNFAVNIAMDRGILNAKTSMTYETCENDSHKDSVRAPILIQNNALSDLTDAPISTLDFALRSLVDTLKFPRDCEIFDLKDGEVPTPLCKGDSVFLQGILLPNATYSWSNGSNQSGTWVKVAGDYSLKVSYCGKTITITYKVFYISFPDQTIALQECDYPFRLEPKQGTDATYKWPNGETTPFLDINGPGTYNVTVTRCEAPYQISFIVSLKTFRDTTLPFMICNYPDFLFPNKFVGPGARFVWDNGDTTGFRVINGPGKYTANVNYCQSNFKITFDVGLDPMPNKNFDFNVCKYPYPIYGFTGRDGVSYRWTDGDTSKGLRIINNPGLYTVVNYYCLDSFRYTYNITLEKFNNQSTVLQDSCAIIEEDSIALVPFIDYADSYEWENGDTSRNRKVNRIGTYHVTLKYCNQEFVHDFEVKDFSESYLLFPNVFPPNSEIKINQIYKPAVKYNGIISDYHIEIYNRWGQKIFTGNKIDEGWNGDYKGAQAPIDTYTYYATMKTECGSAKVFRGSVTLIR